MEYISEGLELHFTPVNLLPKQKCAMRRGMRKLCGLKVRQYTDSFIEFNDYLASLPGDKLSDKIGLTEFNESLLNSMPNSWSKKAYVQGFDCKYITFKKSVNMFECMDIAESIYESVL